MKLIVKAMTIVLLCVGGATQGQGHKSHWVFGDGFHVEFSEAGPSVLPSIEEYIGNEGVSCISDKTGILLYYSNVVNLWNRNFEPLFNSDTFPGFGVPPVSSKASGSLFLTWPGDSSERYVAFLAMNDVNDKLYLSKIDRLLDSGLGGIIDSIKYMQVWSQPIAEQLNAVKHANGRDWWIVARRGATSVSNEFILALLTPEGIAAEGLRETGYFGNFQGTMAFSRSGDMMAVATSRGTCVASPSAIALYHFDRCEGNFEFLDTLVTRNCGQSAYGITFSPDANRIYYSLIGKSMLYQATLVGGQLVDTLIFDLKGSTSFGIEGGNLAIGEDDKIYINFRRALPSFDFDTLSQCLGVVHNPNAFGLECQFDTFGLYLGGPFNVGYSLPTFANYDLGPLVGSPCDSLSPPQDTTQTSISPVLPPQQEWSITPSISGGWYQVNSTQEGWLLVHDLVGREVVREWFSGTTPFDLDGLPAGMYVAAVMVDGAMQGKVHKLLKQ